MAEQPVSRAIDIAAVNLNGRIMAISLVLLIEVGKLKKLNAS
jgi:hypothetical protein